MTSPARCFLLEFTGRIPRSDVDIKRQLFSFAKDEVSARKELIAGQCWELIDGKLKKQINRYEQIQRLEVESGELR